MLARKMDDLLSYHRQFVENNRRSLEQKIKEKEKEVLCQLHDLLTGDLPCDQINQDLQQANDALRAELDKEMEEKKHLCFQSDQQLQKIHQLEAELKTARDLLKESQNYAEEMKNKNLSLETELKKKQSEITHLQQRSAAELACLKNEMTNIKAQQNKLKEQLNILLQETEQVSKVDRN
ncbi:uncharacterized protein ACDP82_003889 [Pangshura tecta]